MPENYGDMAIPEIKLVQYVGGEESKQAGASPGDFYCPITQEIIPGSEGFEIVVIKPAQKTRTYWGRVEIEEEPPICASPDGITSVNGDDCKSDCPHKAYNDAPYMLAAAERRQKCTPDYNVIGIKISDMMPVLIRCTGISAFAAKELNTLLMFHRNIRGQYFKAKLRVTAIKKKTPSGEAFAIKFGDPVLITDPMVQADLKYQAEKLLGVEVPLMAEPPPVPAQPLAPPVTAETLEAKREAPVTEATAAPAITEQTVFPDIKF